MPKYLKQKREQICRNKENIMYYKFSLQKILMFWGYENTVHEMLIFSKHVI